MAAAGGAGTGPRPYGVLRYPGKNHAYYVGRALSIDEEGGTVLVHDGDMQNTSKLKRVRLVTVAWGGLHEPDDLTPVCVRKAPMSQALNSVQECVVAAV